MCLHHAQHNLLIYSKRNIYFCAFYNGWPMLVADGVTKLDRTPDYGFVILVRKRAKVYHKNRTQFNLQNNSFLYPDQNRLHRHLPPA